MKSTINVFLDGITTDMHPLATPKTSLVSAQNATLLTYNGNENILQNDMGNALIVDTKTGNIMGLSDGFVPVGIKEHGGVIYIASYNPLTKEGELGTIPSPVIDYTLNDFSETYLNNKELTGLNEDEDMIDAKISHEFIPIEKDTIFRVGDLFIVELYLDGIFTDNWQTKLVNGKPFITRYDKEGNKEFGLYAITLYSKTITGLFVNITDIINNKLYYWNTNGEYVSSDYWFVPYTEQSRIDLDKTYKKGKDLLTYPNIPSGRLYIKIELEKPFGLKPTYNKTLKLYSPIYYVQ